MGPKNLIDPFGRQIEYLRVSVTDRCDLRCSYCMPKGFNDYTEPEDWLRFDEIERVVRAFVDLGGHRVRLTVDGTLHMCLGQEHAYPLRELLRTGVTDEELCGHITAALALKPERHEFREKPEKVIRFMSMTGG